MRNADNDDLQPRELGLLKIGEGDEAIVVGPLVVGEVDEVNGDGAEELPFMPTRHELCELAKYWTNILIVMTLKAFETGSSSTDIQRGGFADNRLKRLREVLGRDIVEKIFRESEEEWRKALGPDKWDGFQRYLRS
jgi:hypothetical protein